MTNAQRLRQRAEAAQARADRASEQATGISERLEFGQPIILNHHSTKGAQRDRNRADAAIRRAIEEQKKAEALRVKADRAERIERLRAELEAASFGPDDVEIDGVVTWADLNIGRRYSAYVTRINRKSVSVDAGYTVPYDRIIRVRGRVL